MELQAVLLAGGSGSKMYPLTESEVPKALLPIANRPLLSYQLELLERAGFTEVILITSEFAEPLIRNYLAEVHKQSEESAKIELVVVSDGSSTGDALEKAKPLIHGDFVVVSGDLILDSDFLRDMIDLHHIHEPAVTVLFKPYVATSTSAKKRALATQDFIGLVEAESPREPTRFVFSKPMSTVTETLGVRKSLLRRYPELTLYTSLLDAHFYIFSRWVLDLLPELPAPKSIKTGLIPKLLQLQHTPSAVPTSALHGPLELVGDMSSAAVRSEQFLCQAYVLPADKLYCRRSNTSAAFLDINMEVAGSMSSYKPREPLIKKAFIDPSSNVSAQTQVGDKCIVGAGSVVGDKCSIKRSIVGRHCKIGNRVTLSNSVILDHVVIEDNCKISNTIICNNAYLKSNCVVDKSAIGASYELENGSASSSATSNRHAGSGAAVAAALGFQQAWNDTEQLSFFMTQGTPQAELARSLSHSIRLAWSFRQVPGIFAQERGQSPTGVNQTQLPNFGALVPWPKILQLLGNSRTRKLIFLIRHGQAWENLTPGGDNTQCSFVLDGVYHDNVDSNITPLGAQQAQWLNAMLRGPANVSSSSNEHRDDTAATPTWFEYMGLVNATFIASPLARTLETAAIVLRDLAIQQPVQVSELLRATIGHDVCNYRHPVSVNASSVPSLPSPWATGCSQQSFNNTSLQSLYGNLSNPAFTFNVRPPGGRSGGFGLVSDADTLWRTDIDETSEQQVTRSIAFLAQLFSIVESSVVGIVTHGEIIDAFSYAVGGDGYPAANTEVVPMLVDLTFGTLPTD